MSEACDKSNLETSSAPASGSAENWNITMRTGEIVDNKMDAQTEAAIADSVQRGVRRRSVMEAISKELDRAYAKHGCDQWGRHEFYAILKEEVDELWDAIKADHPQGQVVMEAIQVAAMCFRYLETRDRYREPSNAKADLPPASDSNNPKP